jgi:hypothetical protein
MHLLFLSIYSYSVIISDRQIPFYPRPIHTAIFIRHYLLTDSIKLFEVHNFAHGQAYPANYLERNFLAMPPASFVLYYLEY